MRLANGMERVGLNLSGRSGGDVMSAPTQLQPLAEGILATVWSIHTSLLPEGDGWRVLGVLVQGAPWSNQGWPCEESELTISKCTSGTLHTSILIKSRSGCKV